jgi:hypothetical protein
MKGESARRLFVVGDVHLTRPSSAEVTRDLARLLERHPGQRFVFAGDFLDLATDAPRTEPRTAIAEVFAAHGPLRRAMAEFLEGGGELSFLGGNHDAALGLPDAAAVLSQVLGVAGSARARLSTRPWFVREGGVHLEHGHMYDPDNAPGHPLVDGGSGLGAHFSSEFIHPTQAFRFMHRNDAMPLELLTTAFRFYGPRAPHVIARYFHTAFAALAKAGPFYEGAVDRVSGSERHARYAEDAGVPRNVVDAVFSVGVPSTLASWSATFARLYLDRVAATLMLAGGLGALAAGHSSRRMGWTALGLGSALMVGSWLAGQDRYGGTVVARLAEAAARLVDETGAKLVVFGHAHREALGEHYANTGSFTWPSEQAAGRPYLEIVNGERPHALRHRVF